MEDAHTVRAGEPFEVSLRLRVERDEADASLGRGDEQPADRRVRPVVGHVEKPLRGCGVAEAGIEFGGNGHVSLLRSRRTPEEVACRAASSLEPSAAPMSAYGRS